MYKLPLNDVVVLSSLGRVVLQLSGGNCGKKTRTVQQPENLQLALLHLRERLLNFGKDFIINRSQLRRFQPSGLGDLCWCGSCAWLEWNAKVGRKYHWIIRWWELQEGKKKTQPTLSCHLVHSPHSTEHEFSLTVRACSNIQDKLPSSLLHTIPHIYNHPTLLNRFFPIYIGWLQWLSHFVTTLFVTCPSRTCLGLSVSHKKTTSNLVKENRYHSDAKM